jgi:hypothetical protein
MSNQISIDLVLGKLQNRIRAYQFAIGVHENSDSVSTQKTIAEYRAILQELEMLLENFQDLDYKIYFGH